MEIHVRAYAQDDVPAMCAIWNEVVRDGVAYPQLDELSEAEGGAFFAAQSFCGAAVDETGRVLGLYILHPNNVGRCGHIANASYAVKSTVRGLHIGEKLVLHSLETARSLGFQIMQFNAVVAENIHARHLYERLGFQQLGVIPKGFLLKDGRYADICPYYKAL